MVCSTDGGTLHTGAEDGTIKQWNLDQMVEGIKFEARNTASDDRSLEILPLRTALFVDSVLGLTHAASAATATSLPLVAAHCLCALPLCTALMPSAISSLPLLCCYLTATAVLLSPHCHCCADISPLTLLAC